MKSSKEIARTVFQKRDEHLENRRKRNKNIKRIASIGSTACLCAVIVVGVSFIDNKSRIPSVSNSTVSDTTQGSTITEDAQESSDIPISTSSYSNSTESFASTETLSSSSQQDTEKKESISTYRNESTTEQVIENESEYIETIEPTEPITSVLPTENESSLEQNWNKKNLSQQFPEISHFNTIYSLCDTTLEADYVSDYIEDISLSGIDTILDKTYTITGYIYKINNISTQCAFAVKFENSPTYYAYFNRYYRPESLGALIDELSLETTVSFGEVYVKGYAPFTEYQKDTILSLLNAHRNCLISNEVSVSKYKITFATNIELLGISGKSMTFTEDGYVITNIMGQQLAFYIGKGEMDAFINTLGTEQTDYDGVKPTPEDTNITME